MELIKALENREGPQGGEWAWSCLGGLKGDLLMGSAVIQAFSVWPLWIQARAPRQTSPGA